MYWVRRLALCEIKIFSSESANIPCVLIIDPQLQTMNELNKIIGNTDIYLLDQIMKGRYVPSDVILDAGAGGGRNLHWFVQAGCEVYGVDRDAAAVSALLENYLQIPPENFGVAAVESMPFPDEKFDHIICSAVLHFAENHDHLRQMFAEMIRVLKPGGSLFLRVATDVGLEGKSIPMGDGRFFLPDGSERYLLTKMALDALLQRHALTWLEPFKTVLVNDLRSMAVVVLGK